MRKILFCNIAWMNRYQGIDESDKPVNGGQYVKETKDAHEANNFMKVEIENEGEFCFGFVETKWTNGKDRNQLHIERIEGTTIAKAGNYMEGVLIIWCSKNPENDFTSVIGWYKDSVVFRNAEEIEITYGEGSYKQAYFIETKFENCVLLPLKERGNKEKWYVPRRNNKKNLTYGFGQSNIWFADKRNINVDLRKYVDKIIKQIETYKGENLLEIK